MNIEAIARQVHKISEEGTIFLEQYGNEVTEFLNRKDLTAEESLYREILLELTEHIYGIRHIGEYLRKTSFRLGIVEQRSDGEILFDGEVLPLMTELEVYVWDDFFKQNVWTRVFVGGADRKYLVGLNKNYEMKAVPARIRE